MHRSRSNFFLNENNAHTHVSCVRFARASSSHTRQASWTIEKNAKTSHWARRHALTQAVNEMVNSNIYLFVKNWSLCEAIHCTVVLYLRYSVRINYNGCFSFNSVPFIIWFLTLFAAFVGASNFSSAIFIFHFLFLFLSHSLTLKVGFWLDFIKFLFTQ